MLMLAMHEEEAPRGMDFAAMINAITILRDQL